MLRWQNTSPHCLYSMRGFQRSQNWEPLVLCSLLFLHAQRGYCRQGVCEGSRAHHLLYGSKALRQGFRTVSQPGKGAVRRKIYSQRRFQNRSSRRWKRPYGHLYQRNGRGFDRSVRYGSPIHRPRMCGHRQEIEPGIRHRAQPVWLLLGIAIFSAGNLKTGLPCLRDFWWPQRHDRVCNAGQWGGRRHLGNLSKSQIRSGSSKKLSSREGYIRRGTEGGSLSLPMRGLYWKDGRRCFVSTVCRRTSRSRVLRSKAIRLLRGVPGRDEGCYKSSWAEPGGRRILFLFHPRVSLSGNVAGSRPEPLSYGDDQPQGSVCSCSQS